MKIYRYLLLLLLVSACRLSDTNVNPNATADAPVSAILSGAEVSLSFSLGVDAGLITSTVIQQVSGANGDAASNDNYTAGPARFNAVWSNFYYSTFENLRQLQLKAVQQQLPYYKGIARVLLTYGYGTLTDLFGNIPYSQALQLRAAATPVYDRQQDIYKALQLQLDTALQELSQPAADNKGALPGSDDLIFNGDTRKWTAVAWTLKARLALHLSKLGAQQATTQALAYLYNNGSWRGIANSRQDA